MADEERGFYAVQFHPEVTHTVKGAEMLARFVHDICGCGTDWNMPNYVDEAVARIREQVGDDAGRRAQTGIRDRQIRCENRLRHSRTSAGSRPGSG